MALIRSIVKLGAYILLLKKVFAIPEKWSVFFKSTLNEINKLIINSIWIVVIISLFIGAVITIQTQLNMSSPLMPRYTVGLATRDVLLLEFSSAIMCLILSGKVGSNIASEIGTMRVTEQIDALDIMGVNSASYLILPKIVAMVIFIPLLVILSMFTGIMGGYIVALFTDMLPVSTYIYGIQSYFVEYYVWYSIIKSVVFAFIIATVSSFYGFRVKGGALEVGQASTDAVVMSSIIVLLFDVILTKILLQ